jgi:glycerophosphoryl diester phosphodiesterase
MALVSAHRGGAGYDRHREGSLEAIDAAVAIECDYVELDLRRRSDGQVVVCHDAEQADSAPTLDDALDRLGDRVGAHLDFKGTGHEIDAVSLAVAHLGSDRIVVTTAEDDAVRELRAWAIEHAPSLHVGLSTSARSDAGTRRSRLAVLVASWFPRTRMRRSGSDVVVAHRRVAHWWLRSWAHRRGLPLLVWTVDDPAELQRWVNDPWTWMVATNHPERALTIRRP